MNQVQLFSDMEIIPHVVPGTQNQMAFTTVPTLTGNIYDRLRPLLQGCGFPPHTFRETDGMLFFMGATYFMNQKSLEQLVDCLERAHGGDGE